MAAAYIPAAINAAAPAIRTFADPSIRPAPPQRIMSPAPMLSVPRILLDIQLTHASGTETEIIPAICRASASVFSAGNTAPITNSNIRNTSCISFVNASSNAIAIRTAAATENKTDCRVIPYKEKMPAAAAADNIIVVMNNFFVSISLPQLLVYFIPVSFFEFFKMLLTVLSTASTISIRETGFHRVRYYT